jgi:hypothetical protein
LTATFGHKKETGVLTHTFGTPRNRFTLADRDRVNPRFLLSSANLKKLHCLPIFTGKLLQET